MLEDDPNRIVADDKNGFIQIPNQLFEALMVANLTKTQKDICDYLLRRSYGWNQKEAAASINEIADIFNIDRSWVAKQLKDLLIKNVIIRTGNQLDNTAVYKINTIITDWDSNCIDLDQLKNINNSYPIIIMKEQNSCGSTDQQLNLFADQLVDSATTPVVDSTTTPVVVSTTTPCHASSLDERESQAAGNTHSNTIKNTYI